MKHPINKSLVGIALVLVTSAVFAAAESKIGSIMKDNMKGDTSLFKNVATGKGSDADAQKLFDALKELPACKPPKGDPASWKSKTEALVAAAGDVVAKKPGAQQALQKAGNCKACHSEHKAPKA